MATQPPLRAIRALGATASSAEEIVSAAVEQIRADESEPGPTTATADEPAPATATTEHAWSVAGWLSSIESIHGCLSAALLQRVEGSGPAKGLAFLRALVAHPSCKEEVNGIAAVAMLLRDGDVVEHLAEVLWPHLRDLATHRTVGEAHAQNGKFLQEATARELSFGDLATFFGGLEALVGPPNANVLFAVDQEHRHCEDSAAPFATPNYAIRTTSEIEHAFVVHGPAGLTSLGLTLDGAPLRGYPAERPEEENGLSATYARHLQPLSAFDAALDARNRQLTALKQPPMESVELVCARLYTGPMFHKYNLVLRGSPAIDGAPDALVAALAETCRGNLYTTTLHAINSAVVKLSRLTPATRVYRGVRGGVLPPSFLSRNAYNVCGGVECGFMSCTATRAVAQAYAGDGLATGGFVIEIQQGMVDRGASLRWLSQARRPPPPPPPPPPPLGEHHSRPSASARADATRAAAAPCPDGPRSIRTRTRSSLRRSRRWSSKARASRVRA